MISVASESYRRYVGGILLCKCNKISTVTCLKCSNCCMFVWKYAMVKWSWHKYFQTHATYQSPFTCMLHALSVVHVNACIEAWQWWHWSM